MKQIFKNARLDQNVCDLVIEDGKFTFIGRTDEAGIDLQGREVHPGLIDVHIHGAMGKDTMEGDALPAMSAYLAQYGITGFMPTTMTMGMDDIRAVVNAPVPECTGAAFLGYHLEGPYIAYSRRGAQNPAYIIPPDPKAFSELQNVKLVTLAPETEGAVSFIRSCPAVVALGHTDADFDCACTAFDAGAACLTHTFNAMPPLLHRAPGPIGAAIEKNAYVQVICDGFHVVKSVLLLLYRTFGKERMLVISDALRAMGMPEGHYSFGGQEIVVQDGIAKLLDGTVAGSTSHLMKDVQNLISFGIPKEDALFMASRTPAMMMGFHKGLIQEGFDGDFFVSDEALNVSMTVVGGRVVFEQ